MLIKPTKLEHARVELLKSISLKKNAVDVPLEKASERISNKKIDSKLNLPSTANSAVDGYGISSATFFDNPNTVFKVIGVAKAGHPFKEKVLPGQAIERGDVPSVCFWFAHGQKRICCAFAATRGKKEFWGLQKVKVRKICCAFSDGGNKRRQINFES